MSEHTVNPLPQVCARCGVEWFTVHACMPDQTGEWKPMAAARSGRGFTAVVPVPHDGCDRRITDLEGQLRTIADHWPGVYTRYCMACDDTEWPCQVVLDVVVPWMEPEETP